MEQPPLISQRRDEPEFSLREWAAKAKVGRDTTISRRFSGSYIRSFREDARSFRSNITTITSTASSPGYPFGDEIDPATYSFTNAIKALQARSLNSWECFSLDGFTLNSKWNEAEKYICNPLSGEVPMECLSAKSLSGRSFRNLTNRIAISAPLVYSNHSQQIQTKPCSITQVVQKLPVPEKKVDAMTRDVGTQSTPSKLGSDSPSPASTPPIVERALKRCELEQDSPNSNSEITPEAEISLIVLDYKYSLHGLVPSSEEYRLKSSEVHLRSAKRLLKLCQVNKGFYVKAGQFAASLRQAPNEYSSTLSSLQDQAVPCPFKDIKEVLISNLGSDISAMFLSLEEQPLAAASIAQVHRAILKNNQEVAIKVQYPGLMQHVKIDTTVMNFLSKTISWLFPDYRFEWLASEFERTIFLELDFTQEARNAERTAENFKNNNLVKIPRVYWQW